MEILNSRELASYLKISPTTIKVYRHKHPDRLPPSFMLNGQYRWDKEQVDRWLNEKAREGRI